MGEGMRGLLILLVLIAGCYTPASEVPYQKEDIVLTYYFVDWCGNCQDSALVIKYINENYNISYVPMNLTDKVINDSETISYLKMVEEFNLGDGGVPIVFLQNQITGESRVYLGRIEIRTQVEDQIRGWKGLPDASRGGYGKVAFSQSECNTCHSERGLEPPSTYNCTSCCHLRMEVGEIE
jgi:hypothetical protein